jgi:CheY-like chemotaxis protein
MPRMARIAIIDASRDCADMLQFLLSNARHKAQIFGSGIQFLESFQSGKFDLIALELALPGLDGFGTFTRIREVDSRVPMITITSCAFPADREKALQHGFRLHVTKPIVDFDVFLSEMSQLLVAGKPVREITRHFLFYTARIRAAK